METREKLTDFLMITVGTVICAAAVFFFLIPSSLTVGSISGLAIILSNLIPLSISVITFILNVGLLLLGFLLIGREFGTKTVYTSVLVPAVLWSFPTTSPSWAIPFWTWSAFSLWSASARPCCS